MKSLRETRMDVQLADRPCFLVQRFSHIPCARKIRFAVGQRTSFCSRQMRGLREDQELVEGIYTEAADQFQSDGETHATEVVHRLVEREATGIAQSPVRAPQLVFDNISGIAKEDTACFLLALDHMPHDANQLVEQVLLG